MEREWVEDRRVHDDQGYAMMEVYERNMVRTLNDLLVACLVVEPYLEKSKKCHMVIFVTGDTGR